LSGGIFELYEIIPGFLISLFLGWMLSKITEKWKCVTIRTKFYDECYKYHL